MTRLRKLHNMHTLQDNLALSFETLASEPETAEKEAEHHLRLQDGLLAHPSVEECVVLARHTSAGEHEIAAYIVSSGPFLPDRLQAHLTALALPEPLPTVYVPIDSLPLTPEGQPDIPSLKAVPVLDSWFVERCEAELRGLPGVAQAAALIGEYLERRAALPLADLIPERTSAEKAEKEFPSGASAEKMAASAPTEESVASRTGTASGRLSLSEGAPIRLAQDEPTTLQEALRRASQKFGARGMVYVQSDGSEIEATYAELKDEAERLLAGLRKLGLRPGDKVLFQLDQNQDFLPGFWGCILGGFIPVPISIAPTYDQPNANIAKLHNAWLMLERPVILAGENLTPHVASLATLLAISPEAWRVVSIDTLRKNEPDTDWHVSQPADPALMLLTSGSTGKPKGVVQRHSSLLLRSAATVQDNAFGPEGISLNWFPMDHVGGIVMFHVRDVYLGGRQIHAPTNYIVQAPLKWLDLIEKHRVTNTWAPNFAYGLVNARADEVARGAWDLSTLQFILNAGEAIVARTARRFLEILQPHGLPGTAMRPSWGMSETCSAVTFAHDFTLGSTSDEDSFVEVGGPIPGFAMRIVDGNENLVEEGTIGRLQVRGPSVTTGYYKNEEINRESFTTDGWFNTGDLGVFRDGCLTITGRQKDVIIINGVNFYSHEIEAVAEEVDGVEVSFTAACAVRVAGKDTDDICIFFHSALFSALTDQENRTATEDEQRNLLREIRGAVVRNVGINPTFLVPVEKAAIPKTEIGKIQRAQLRQRFEAGEFAGILKTLDVLTASADTIPDWFFRTVWRQKALSAVGYEPLVSGLSLVFAGDDPLSASLVEGLAANGPVVKILPGDAFARLDATTFRLKPEDPAHYTRLLAALTDLPLITRVVHCWTYGRPEEEHQGAGALLSGAPAMPSASNALRESVETLEIGQERGLYSLLALVQALAGAQNTQSVVRIQVVSSHSQCVLPDDPIVPGRMSLPGLIKTVSQEMPALDIAHTDLSVCVTGTPSLQETPGDRERILAELACPFRSQSDREAAYRHGRRYVARLERAPLTEQPSEERPFSPGGLVLVTGGLGGIGTEVAARLLRDYRSRVLLIGRSPLPAQETWETCLQAEDPAAERIRAYQRLAAIAVQSGGEERSANGTIESEALRYAALDAADVAGLHSAVEQACTDWNCRLEVVLHLAGSYHDCLLLEETPESFQEILHPKIIGALALHQIARGYPGCRFISFSSAVACFGGAMIGAYVTANRFLSGFADFQRQQGMKSYCFAWSTWDGTGMSRGYGGKDPLRARGFMDMSVAQGIDSMLAALHRESASLVIGLEGANAFVRRHLEPRSPEACRAVQLTAYGTVVEGATAASLPAAIDVTDRYGLVCRCAVRKLSAMPLTAAGEIDRPALADLERRLAGGAHRVAARTETEKRVLAIWQEALGTAVSGVFDNFFELGGHSLLATQVIARLRDVFGIELPLRRLFETPTVAGLAEWLENTDAEQATGARLPIERASRDQDLPLSYTQQRLWFIDQLEPGNPVYNIPAAFRLQGQVNVLALKRAIDEIVQRHEALRTLFPSRDGIPSQSILADLSIDLPEIDLSGLAAEEQEAAAQQSIVVEARRPFDLAHGPLLRALLLKLSDDRRILLVNTHHIISDGWSLAVFNRELSALYDAFTEGLPSPLPALPIQYADYAVWQRQALQGAEMERLTGYWKQQLAGASLTLNLPTDLPRPPAQAYRGAKVFFSLPLGLAEAARALSQQHGTTLYMTLLAAFQTLLHRLTEQNDILIGSPIAGRTHTETEPLIGFLANTLVLRTEFSGDPTFAALLTRVREAAVGAYSHQEMPFEKLVETLRPPRDPSRNSLFQANFRLLTIAPTPLMLTGLQVEPIDIDPGIARFDIAMELWSYPDRFGGYFEYNTDLFVESSVRRLLTLFEETLTALCAAPDQPIDTLFPSKGKALLWEQGPASSEDDTPDRNSKTRVSLRETRRKAVPLS